MDNRITAQVRGAFHIFVLASGVLFVGCGLMRTSYHVVTAPIRLFTGGEDEPDQSATTSTTTTTTTEPLPADVSAPGQSASPAPPPPRKQAQSTVAHRSPSPAPRTRVTEAEPKPPATPRASPPAAEFPTAKPVPGKPGYVFDPFNANGGYIDVSGYPPGSKVKDPATKKIFIVP